MVKVSNMISERSGREVANQFVVQVNDDIFFQSYDSTIVKIGKDGVTLGDNYNYSVTTSKYLRQFMEKYANSMWYKMQSTGGKSVSDICKRSIDAGIVKYDSNL